MKNEKRRGLVWVDWLLLFALLLGGGVIALRIRHGVRSAEASEHIVYRLTFSADKALAWESLLPIGGAVTSANGTALLGEIVAIEQTPLKTALVQDGRVIFVAHPDHVQLTVTVRADAVEREGDGLRVGDIRIAADGVGDFRIGSYFAEGARVLSVRRGA